MAPVHPGVFPAIVLEIIVANLKKAVLVRLREVQQGNLFPEQINLFGVHHAALPEQTEHSSAELLLPFLRDMGCTDAS